MAKAKEEQSVPNGTDIQNKTGHTFHVPEGVKYLDPLQLADLSRAFERWYKDTSGAATKRARGRVWLTFLVLRYSGAKLGETLALDEQTDFDPEQGLIHFRNRSEDTRTVQLPMEVAQEIQSFVKNPENACLQGMMFKMDQGHIRRKFQEVGAICGMPMSLSNPTVLRRSRAIELLRGDMPLKIVQRILGQGTANLAANFFDFSDNEVKKIVNRHIQKENTRKMSARNTFFGKVTRIATGDIQSEIEVTTLGGYTVTSVITNGSLRSMGLKTGHYVTAIVKAPWVVLSKGELSPMTSCRNKLRGKVISVQHGKIASEVTVGLDDGVNVCAVVTEESILSLGLQLEDTVWAMFSSSSVIVLSD